MSCVAEAKATSSAPSPTISGAASGSRVPRNTIVAISTSCEATSQPRRRPKRRDRHGTCQASTTGAQRNFNVYGSPASDSSPMVPRSTPRSAIHTRSVSPDSASGSPEEKPSSMMTSTRGRR